MGSKRSPGGQVCSWRATSGDADTADTMNSESASLIGCILKRFGFGVGLFTLQRGETSGAAKTMSSCVGMPVAL
jgi:hypothetical protein